MTEATGWWRQGPCQERPEGGPRAGTRGLQGGLSDLVGAACGLRNQSSASATRLRPDVTPCGQVGRWRDPRVDFRGGQGEALNWETWPEAGLRVLRTDEVLWGQSRYRIGEAWETREPWREWGSRLGGLEAFGGQEKEGVPPGLPSGSFSTQ